MRLVVAVIALVVLDLASASRMPTGLVGRAFSGAPLYAQSADIEALRQRVGTAVRRFITDFSNVVTEEAYEQRFAVGTRKRRLKSDFLLVAYPGRPQFVMVFRDVREVDGKAVGDKQERITKLFLQPFDNAIRRAQDIHREGLRRSVDNGRLSDPLTAIGYLQPEYQAGFRFSLGDPAPTVGTDVRIIDLVPTPARGRTAKQTRAWVSETTGDVFKTEVRAGFGARAEITTTTFGIDPVLKIRVPLEMRDEMPRGSNDEFIGIAKYTNIRRFDVKTDAVVDVPANPSPR